MGTTPRGIGTVTGFALFALGLGMAGVVAAPTAGADDRSCTSTSANTTICSRPGGSTSINTSPAPVVGPAPSCGFGVGLDYMCGGGVTWNIGGIFNRR